MIVQKAEEKEFFAVRAFYHEVIEGMESAIYRPGWKKGIYPSDEDLMEALRGGELYLGMENETIAAAMVLNRRFNESYEKISWPTPAGRDETFVLHMLCVHPQRAGQGLARQMVQSAVSLARAQGGKALRLDVLEGNLPAEKLYPREGFQYVATLPMFYEDTGWTNFKLYELKLSFREKENAHACQTQ